MNPPEEPPPTIVDVADIMAYHGFGREVARVQTPNGNRILSPDALAAARMDYYNDVPNMSLATLRRERNPDIIPQMTVEQLRTLSDELYLTMTPNELRNRYNHFLRNNPNFPEEINDPDSGPEYNLWLGRGFNIFWERGGIVNSPTNLFDGVLRLNIEHYQEWRENNERRYFETIYRALITPIPNGGGKRNRRTKRRKTRKSRKNKRKTKRRRA